MREYSVLGKSLPKKDSLEKASGQAKYTGDLMVNNKNVLYGKILRSPHAHARILSIDTSKAERLPGVKAVVTGKDITDKPHGIVRVSAAPPWLKDKFILAKDKVRYIGDDVAAVAAVDEYTAEEALGLIDVKYEILPAVFDPFEAMKDGAPKIHDHAENNVSLKVAFDFGEVEKGFAESDHIFTEHFETNYTCHAPLETHTAIADYTQSGEVVLHLSTQVPFYDQVVVAETLGIPVSKVRIIKPHVGGGFGGKAESHSIFVVAAVLSKAAGMPVKMVHTREEEIACTSVRHPTFIDQKVGITKDGIIKAIECTLLSDGGSYNSYGPATLFLHGGMQNGPYKCNNFRYNGTRIYTNKPMSGAQRGHGGIQVRFAMESLMDIVAEKLNIDPSEIRIRNTQEVGDITPSGSTINSCGHVECIEKARDEIGWADKRGKMPFGKGVGIASNFFVSGAAFTPFFDHPDSHSAVVIDAHEDGMFTLRTGTADIGQGSMTVLAQIVAEETGVTLDDVNVIAGDTGCTPMDLGSFSSRVTMFAGNATRNAAADMRKVLIETAANKLEANPDDLDARDGRIFVKGSSDRGITVSETIRTFLTKEKRPMSTSGFWNPPGDDEAEFRLDNGKVNMTPAWTYGAHAIEVEVDTATGFIDVKNIAAGHDCGFALNPMSVEGQIEGSVHMTYGQALTEDIHVKDGHTLNASFLGYKFPTAMDNPPIHSIIVESNDKVGPYGAKEASEGPNIPVCPAIANAVYDAIGVRITDLPITPEKILKALREKQKV